MCAVTKGGTILQLWQWPECLASWKTKFELPNEYNTTGRQAWPEGYHAGPVINSSLI